MKPAARLLRNVRPAASARVLEVPHPRPVSPKGFDEGYREGQQAARHEAEQLLLTAQAHLDTQRAAQEQAHRERLAALDALIKGLAQAHSEAPHQQAHSVVTLAYEALLRILHDAHDSRPLIARIVSQALREEPYGELTLRLHPADHARLAADDAVRARLAALPNLRCLPDEGLKPGDCLIDTPQGSQDISLSSQLRALTQAWLVALGERDEGGHQ